MISSQANLNRVSERRGPDYFYGRTRDDAHFHQATRDRTRSLHVHNSRCQTPGKCVERSCFVRSRIRLFLVFPQLLSSSLQVKLKIVFNSISSLGASGAPHRSQTTPLFQKRTEFLIKPGRRCPTYGRRATFERFGTLSVPLRCVSALSHLARDEPLRCAGLRNSAH